MKQIKTFQYKLKPTKEQEHKLEQWLGTCRYVYNLALEYKKTLWEHYRVNVTKYDMQSELVRLTKEVDWIRQVSAHARELVIERLFRAYDTFFRKGGFPRFAKKGKYNSIEFRQVNNNLRFCPTSKYVILPKFGKVRYYNSQPCDGSIKTASVKKLADGWHIFVFVEADVEMLPASENKIGIDVGIISLLTTSTGETITNPKHLNKHEKKIKRLQRAVSRKKRGSNNRKKAIKKLALQHQKVANCRRDFQHKLTTRLIRENQTIVVENVSPAGMIKSNMFSKSLSDAAWGSLFYMLSYKAEWHGRIFLKVPAQYTTMTCSNCNYILEDKLSLKQRVWTCPNCGTIHDRDINAAINISNRAKA